MATKRTFKIKNFPLRYYFMAYVLLLGIPILVTLSWLDYLSARHDLSRSESLMREQTETGIINAIKLVDGAYKMFEKSLEVDMQKAFEPFLLAYNQAGGDPALIPLEQLKNNISDNMDLYIINAEGIVIRSTYQTDIGLDFKQIPDFFEYITALRLGNKFSADRITPEVRTGILRKFAYMPTPDHKYLLELGLVSDEFKESIAELNYVKVARELEDINPSLNGIRIFDRMGNLIGQPGIKPNQDIISIIQNVFSERKSREIRDDKNERFFKYLFVDLKDDRYATDVSKVVELCYTTRLMNERLKTKQISHLSISLLFILIAIILTSIVAVRVTRPINQIIKGVNKIAHGDIEHRISIETKTELKILERSINIMVRNLKDSIVKVKESEEKLRQYSHHLDDLVKARTAELQAANDDLKALIHSISHDLRAPLRAIYGFAEALLEDFGNKLNTNGRDYAQRILNNTQYLETLIQDLIDYNYLSRTEIPLEPVSLEKVVDEVLLHFEHEIADKQANVIVNRPLPEVLGNQATLFTAISNLLSNALKYVAAGVIPRVSIYAEQKERWIRLWVDDNGIGIPTEDQERIFGVFERLHSREEYPGTGIGLAMVKRGIERMNGSLGVESVPGMGSRFWIQLRKAES